MARLKAQGLKPGVSDYFLPVPAGEFHGLWIELKRETGSRTSPEQELFQRRMRWLGYRAAICFGADGAKEALQAYLALSADISLPLSEWPQ